MQLDNISTMAERVLAKEPDFKEPKIKWKKSQARALLYNDVLEGRVPLDPVDYQGRSTMKLEEIFRMHTEYQLYDRKKFSRRLSSIRDVVRDLKNRKEIDEDAFNVYRRNHLPSLTSSKGYPEWQGSNAQTLVCQDLENEVNKGKTMSEFWLSRPEYYENYPLAPFKHKVRQEIRTAKYIHTCETREQNQVAS